MSLESFYGGRQGESFVIVKSFPSVAEMVENFQKGPDYSAVHYNEHVLINTVNKNDADNGKIYRRGYDYTNELGGAIYIGTIVGPAGRAPMLEMTSIENVKEKQALEGQDYRYSEGEYAPLLDLVPGKVSDTEFNDAIEWACCCIRNENNEDSTAYIGFRFPYTVIEFDANAVDPYYHRNNDTDNFINEHLVDRLDDEIHPFYEKWNISVPKGIKGDTFKNFRIVQANSTIEDYNGKDNDIAGINGDSRSPREILVYDYYHYDKDGSGEPVSLYLGDHNMIKHVDMTNEGTITIEYTHNDDEVYEKIIKWVKEISLDEDNGHFTIKYNHELDKDGNPTTYETDLNWVKNISLDENGTVTIDYSYIEDRVYEKVFKWIKNVSLDKTNGHFAIEFNHETDVEGNPTIYETDLSWINNIEIDEDGTINIFWSTGENEALPTKMKWITNIKLENDGTVIVNYNDTTSDAFVKAIQWISNVSLSDEGEFLVQYNNGAEDYETTLTWVDNMSIAEDGTITITYNHGDPLVYNKMLKYIDHIYFNKDENKFHIVYNTGDDEPVDEQINYIVETAIDKKDYHFLVYYSDSNVRQALIDAGLAREYNGKDGWADLGSIKEDSGVLIGLNISASLYDAITGDIEAAINYLNTTYPDGLTDPRYYGRIVTVGEEFEHKYFYAFDYEHNNWYFLGTFYDSNSIEHMFSAVDEIDVDQTKNKLVIGGVWFVLDKPRLL